VKERECVRFRVALEECVCVRFYLNWKRDNENLKEVPNLVGERGSIFTG
jgi:hypothetical protein